MSSLCARGRGALLSSALLLAPFFSGIASGEAPGDRESLRSGPRAKRDHLIPWVPWSPSAFARARDEGKLVLLNLTASWSHWCHVMDETSYSDPHVTYLIANHYVPVRVDGDRRPDVRDRYLSGGWPTTAVLTPDGLALVSQTYVDPKPLRRILAESRQIYRRTQRATQEREAVARKYVDGLWESEPPDTFLARSEALATYVDHVLQTALASEDRLHGGFGVAPKTPEHDTISLLIAAGGARHDTTLTRAAFRGIDALRALEDTIGGGFHRYALGADWTRIRYEKPLDENARAIAVLAEGYRALGRPGDREAVQRTAEYLGRVLWDEAGRGFYGGQDSDVGSHDSAGTYVSGDVYYTLGREARRSVGEPSADSTLYVDMNARAISALLRAVSAGALEEPHAERPLRALDRLWDRRRAEDGSFVHAWPSGSGPESDVPESVERADLVSGLLLDLAPVATACIDAFEFTADEKYAQRARALADWMRAHLEDTIGGGFRYAPRDTTAVGRLRAGDKPEAENIEAAMVFLRLSWIEGGTEDRRSAERAYAWLRGTGTPEHEAARALLALLLLSEPVRFATRPGAPPK